MKIYGWREQNESCYGLESIDIRPSAIYNIDEETQEVSFHGSELETFGCWFRTFRAAKLAALLGLRNQKEWINEAIREIKKIKKCDC